MISPKSQAGGDLEQLLAKPVERQQVLAAISSRIDRTPGLLSLIRAALLAITPGSGNNKEFEKTKSEFERLFRGANMSSGEHNLKRFALAIVSEPRNPNLVACLMLFIVHKRQQEEKLDSNHGFADAVGGMDGFDIEVETWVREQGVRSATAAPTPVSIPQPPKRFGIEEHALQMLSAKSNDQRVSRLFGLESRGLSEFQARHQGDAADQADTEKSYYAMYRYSTIRSEIVKTFLVVSSPKPTHCRHFTFSHFYQGLYSETRETRGLALLYHRSIYLLGGSTNPENGRFTNLKGIKLVAIPDDVHNPSHRCIAGIFLSNAGAWQPIVGRVVMVHLGFSRSHPNGLRHDEIGIGLRYLSPEAVPQRAGHGEQAESLTLAGDLAVMEKKFAAATAMEMTVPELTKWVLDRIDNLPSELRKGGIGELQRALTIETFGSPLE